VGGGASFIYSKKKAHFIQETCGYTYCNNNNVMHSHTRDKEDSIYNSIRIIVMIIIAKLRDRDDNTTVQNTCLCNQSIKQSINQSSADGS